MNNKKRIKKLRAGDYQRLFGVKKETFDKMMEILEKSYVEKHRKGGKPPKLTVLDKLIITLQYYREYRTMEHIAFDYGVYKSTICDAIHWVEEVLVKEKVFHLPSKNQIAEDETVKNVAVDVTEVEIERPQKKQKEYYSGKKKRHTLKLQIAADADNKNILRIAVSSGKTHDFKLFKESRLILPDDTLFVLDKAYQGIFEIHPMSLIPIKATKNHKLTPEEKAFNSFVSKLRIFIEHINRYIKRFRILSSRYRNKRKRFTLRATLICAIYNFQHSL